MGSQSFIVRARATDAVSWTAQTTSPRSRSCYFAIPTATPQTSPSFLGMMQYLSHLVMVLARFGMKVCCDWTGVLDRSLSCLWLTNAYMKPEHTGHLPKRVYVPVKSDRFIKSMPISRMIPAASLQISFMTLEKHVVPDNSNLTRSLILAASSGCVYAWYI